jgi:CDP-diacylglycerol--glycerol-3-phosphate 3-phosphatidyltransferase
MFTLPNLLTCCRLLTAPVFIAFFLVDRPWAAIAALGMAIFFEITDMLDGYIARHYAQVSSIGKLIDPLADSVARFSVFLAFVTESTVRGEPWPVLLVAVIFYRDATVACIRTFAAYTGTVLAARVSGKIKAVVQGTGILVFLGVRATSHFSGYFMQVRRDVFYWVLIPIAVVTAISGVDYVLSNRSAIVDITEDGATD